MREEPYETFEHEGLTVKIYPDSDPQKPDDWGDENAFLVHYHDQCWIARDNLVTRDDVADLYRNEKTDRTRELKKKYHLFPVEAYIHSGVVLSLGDKWFPDRQWDVSHVGMVFLAKSEWKTRKKAETYAKGLIEEWNQYLSGDVWGWVVEDKNGEHLDSCWGFYGLEYAKLEGTNMAKSHAADLKKAREAKLKAMVRNHVPLEKRQEVLA